MFKGLSEIIGESVGGWVLAGAAAIILAPTLSNVVRGMVVGTARGVLSLAEGGSMFASNMREGWDNIINEAKLQKGMRNIDTSTVVGAGAGGALGASIGGGMGGPMGAAVGGGLGSVVGASVGSSVTNPADKENHENKG